MINLTLQRYNNFLTHQIFLQLFYKKKIRTIIGTDFIINCLIYLGQIILHHQ